MIEPIAKKHLIRVVYWFGTHARGVASEENDIDLPVDTAGTSLTSLALGALYGDLEEMLKKPIALITVRSLRQKAQMPSKQDFREAVLNERVKLYDVS